jgi:hypothetical protein
MNAPKSRQLGCDASPRRVLTRAQEGPTINTGKRMTHMYVRVVLNRDIEREADHAITIEDHTIMSFLGGP